MDLTVVIVSYNTRDLTLACLESIYHQTRGLDYEVIVVDNQSADGSADAISQQFPQAKLLRPGKNLGFAGANNYAAQQARGEFLLLLNPDTVILDGAVQKVHEFATRHPEAGIFGGRTLFADRSLNPNSCHGRPTPWSLLCMGLGLSAVFRRSRWFDPESLGPWPRDTVAEVDAVTGCFLLIRREWWQRLGGFDETFFMYGEDTDLCLRAWQQGSKCLICPDAELIHYGGASEKIRADKMIRLFRAKAQLVRKHWRPGSVWFGLRMLDLWALSRMIVTGLLQMVDPRRADAYRAWRDVWQGRERFHAI